MGREAVVIDFVDGAVNELHLGVGGGLDGVIFLEQLQVEVGDFVDGVRLVGSGRSVVGSHVGFGILRNIPADAHLVFVDNVVDISG